MSDLREDLMDIILPLQVVDGFEGEPLVYVDGYRVGGNGSGGEPVAEAEVDLFFLNEMLLKRGYQIVSTSEPEKAASKKKAHKTIEKR